MSLRLPLALLLQTAEQAESGEISCERATEDCDCDGSLHVGILTTSPPHRPCTPVRGGQTRCLESNESNPRLRSPENLVSLCPCPIRASWVFGRAVVVRTLAPAHWAARLAPSSAACRHRASVGCRLSPANGPHLEDSIRTD